MSSISLSNSTKPYNLELVSNDTTTKWGFTAEKVAQLETELLKGDVSSLMDTLQGLPKSVTWFFPHMAGSLNFDNQGITQGIYDTFPSDTVKWILYHVENNLGVLTDVQCVSLHESFCYSELFSGDVPHPLAFSLTSPFFRATQNANVSVTDLAPDPTIATSFINHRVVPHYVTFTEAAKLIKVFHYWKLDDTKVLFFNNDEAVDRCITGDPNRTWGEMLAAFDYDPDYLAYLKERFCDRFIKLCGGSYRNYPKDIRVLPFSMIPLICNGGLFYDHLLESSNSICILDFQLSYVYQANLLKVSHPALLSKFKCVVAKCELLNMFIRFIESNPSITRVYLYPEPTVLLCSYTTLLDRGIHITFARSFRFCLEVEDTAVLKKVTFEWPNDVTIKAKKMTDSISIAGWATMVGVWDRKYHIDFRELSSYE